jgi:hypothetical protein
MEERSRERVAVANGARRGQHRQQQRRSHMRQSFRSRAAAHRICRTGETDLFPQHIARAQRRKTQTTQQREANKAYS